MSLLTLSGQGPRLNIEAPNAPPQPPTHSTPHRWLNISPIICYMYRTLAGPAALAQRQDTAQQQSRTVQHFLETWFFPQVLSEQDTADPLRRIYFPIFRASLPQSQSSCILLVLETVIIPKTMQDLSDCLLSTSLKSSCICSLLQYCASQIRPVSLKPSFSLQECGVER